jgi:3-oxoacyl-[acyl-carrier protein] reductase
VVGLTRVLAREFGRDGIRVNAIAPGYVPFPKRHSPRTAEANRVVQEQIRSAQCIQETLTPDDLAGTIEFLCSSDSDAITGQVLNLDNGWTHGGH